MKLPLVTLALVVYGAFRPRRASSSPPWQCAAGLLFLALAACSVPAAQSDPPGTYRIDQCAEYAGVSTSLDPHCKSAYMTSEAHCDGEGGQIYRASHDGGRTWSCNAKWDDANVGGSLCAHFVCAIRPPGLSDPASTTSGG